MGAPTRREPAPTGRPSSLSTSHSAAVEVQGTSRLEAEEAIIRRGLAESAAALIRIRDGKLYLEADYGSFDDYCTDRLGFGRGRADQIIGAGRTLAALPTNVGTTGWNEAQLRVLAPYRDEPELLAEIIHWATGSAEHRGVRLTAAVLADAAERVLYWREQKAQRTDRFLNEIDIVNERLRERGLHDDADAFHGVFVTGEIAASVLTDEQHVLVQSELNKLRAEPELPPISAERAREMTEAIRASLDDLDQMAIAFDRYGGTEIADAIRNTLAEVMADPENGERLIGPLAMRVALAGAAVNNGEVI